MDIFFFALDLIYSWFVGQVYHLHFPCNQPEQNLNRIQTISEHLFAIFGAKGKPNHATQTDFDFDRFGHNAFRLWRSARIAGRTCAEYSTC
jgi:hypothetical protein